MDIGDATPGKLAKLANFVSESVSSQSQALGSGAPSETLNLTITWNRGTPNVLGGTNYIIKRRMRSMKRSQKILFAVLAIVGIMLTLHINNALAYDLGDRLLWETNILRLSYL